MVFRGVCQFSDARLPVETVVWLVNYAWCVPVSRAFQLVLDTGQPVETFQKCFATLSPRLILIHMKVMLEVGTNWEVCYEVKNVYYLFVVQLVFSQKMLTVTRIKCQGEFVILVTVILPY